MKDQQKECAGCCNPLLLELIKQNNLLIQQGNQKDHILSQVVQINNEQTAQINELLIRLEDEVEEPKRSRNLDD